MALKTEHWDINQYSTAWSVLEEVRESFLRKDHGGDILLILKELTEQVEEEGNEEDERMYLTMHREDFETTHVTEDYDDDIEGVPF